MPNWCVGELKIRGKTKNIKKFLLEGLKEPAMYGNYSPCKENEWGIYGKGCHYIEGTRRGFIYDIEYEPLSEDDEETIALINDVEFAWQIDAEGLQKVSKIFELDFHIFGVERGMEFVHEVEVVGGEILTDRKIKYDNFEWDCFCANKGG